MLKADRRLWLQIRELRWCIVDILDKWLDDLPQQFQGKKYIEALISVFAKQLEDLYKVFEQLDTETDLDSAVGMNLDMVGDIVTPVSYTHLQYLQ